MLTDEELYGTDSPEDGIEESTTHESTSEGEPRQQAEQETSKPEKQPKPKEEPKPVNWLEQPEFKQWQQKYETRIKQTEREKQDMLHRLGQYEQQLEQLSTRDLDDQGKLAYENQKLRRLVQGMQQQQAEQQGRQRIFNEIQATLSEAGMAVPYDELDQALDADDAWKRAFKYMQSQMNEKTAKTVAERLEKRDANAVDLGGGTPASEGSDLQSRYNRAMKSFNTRAVLDIMEEADYKGVKLQL